MGDLFQNNVPPAEHSEKISMSSALGLEDKDNKTNPPPNILGATWDVKEGLKVYFLTIRLRVDISHEVVTELVTCLRGHKHYK